MSFARILCLDYTTHATWLKIYRSDFELRAGQWSDPKFTDTEGSHWYSPYSERQLLIGFARNNRPPQWTVRSNQSWYNVPSKTVEERARVWAWLSSGHGKPWGGV